MPIRESIFFMPEQGGGWENDPKVPFVSACGGLKCPCETFLAQLGNAHGQKISYHSFAMRIREHLLKDMSAHGGRMEIFMKTVSVIGGDLRQITLAGLLAKDGFEVKIFGFDKDIDTHALKRAESIESAASADIIILPLPATHDGIMLNAPFSDGGIGVEELCGHIPPNSLIFGGKLSGRLACLCKERKLYDYFKREELSIANAIPTAEGAVEIAMSETAHTIHNAKCLVIGYGRIGKILADRLRALGADVTVSARKYSDFAWIDAFRFKKLHSSALGDDISDFGIIFNTVPTVILNDVLLEKIPDDTLIIDLASKPGGVDFELAKELGKRVIWALSLPGKCAPITSGEIIKNTIINMLREMEEL